MSTFEQLSETQRDRLNRISTAYGITPERLLAAMERRESLDRDVSRAEIPHPVVAQKRKASRFHIGESTSGYRR